MITKRNFFIALGAATLALAPHTSYAQNIDILEAFQKNSRKPDLFKGEAGYKPIEGTTQFTSKIVATKDVFAIRNVEFVRTGIVTAETKYGSLLDTYKLKEGTLMYAARYGRGQLGWCTLGTVRVGASNVLNGHDGARCFFYKVYEGNAYVLNGGPKGSRYLASKLNATHGGIDGPIPHIDEQPINIERTFKLSAQFIRFGKKTLRLKIYFNDGEKTELMQEMKIKKEKNGSALVKIWGGELKFIPDGKKKAQIEIIQPLNDNYMSLEEAQKALVEKMNAFKNNGINEN